MIFFRKFNLEKIVSMFMYRITTSNFQVKINLSNITNLAYMALKLIFIKECPR